MMFMSYNLQIAYHAEFEKGKGQYTSVTDAPEFVRLKKNQELVSSVTENSFDGQCIFSSRFSVTIFWDLVYCSY